VSFHGLHDYTVANQAPGLREFGYVPYEYWSPGGASGEVPPASVT
jgi:hypothetical protein